MHVSHESLEQKFPGEGRQRYNAIALIVGAEMIHGPYQRHDGGLDLTGVFADETVYTKDQQADVKGFAENKGYLKKEAAKENAPAAIPATPAPHKNEDKKDGDK